MLKIIIHAEHLPEMEFAENDEGTIWGRNPNLW